MPFRFETLSIKKKKKKVFAFIKQLVKKKRNREGAGTSAIHVKERLIIVKATALSLPVFTTPLLTKYFSTERLSKSMWEECQSEGAQILPKPREKIKLPCKQVVTIFKGSKEKPQYSPILPKLQRTSIPHKSQTLLKPSVTKINHT